MDRFEDTCFKILQVILLTILGCGAIIIMALTYHLVPLLLALPR